MTVADAVTRSVSSDQMLELYRRMVRIRRFEERTSVLYAEGVVPGFVHVSIGQEASSVGVCWPLRDTDGIVSTHRGHGHCLAKGADIGGMFAELMGRKNGTCGGMGGSMHIAELSKGVYGANGIVGAGLPIAVGVAQSFRLQHRDDVVAAFFGDGAIAQGAFHESLNLAALWHLPVLFVCENNHYAEFSPMSTQHPVPIVQRALAYGIEAMSVDGNDVVEVATTVERLVERMRSGEGPFLLETLTYRWHGHYEGDPVTYRTQQELADWKQRDPLVILAARLDDQGFEKERLAIEQNVDEELLRAEEFGSNGDYPSEDALYDLVLAPRPTESSPLAPGTALRPTEKYRVMDAVHDAIQVSLQSDDRVFLAGIDVGEGGNIFGLTRGLKDEFPERVLDTPISETAIVGLAVGAAMAGSQPIVEIMYLDFIGVAFDQIMNQAAKLHFMTGGKAPMSLVIRTQTGAGRSSAAQHSQSLEALLAHIPGLTVVMPSTPEDTYGLLRAAIADPNPVIFIEHRLLYGKKGTPPSPDLFIPIGKAAIRREGTDVTLVSWSRMVDLSLEAAELASAQGVSVEVIDLRTVAPFDEAAILQSVRKTGRLVVAHEAVKSGGLGAEIVARISDAAIWDIDAPMKRVAAAFTPAPYSPALEKLWLPDAQAILEAVLEVARS